MAAGFFALYPFLHNGIVGGDDARWYTTVVADQVEQWRLGLWPSFVGQTRYAPIGTVLPIRVAPLLQHVTVVIDFVTLHRLRPYVLLNLALISSSTAASLSAYLCLRAILPLMRKAALALAVLYIWCPGVVGLPYTGQLFMSTMTLPFLPLAFTGLYFIFKRDSFLGWCLTATGCAGCFLAHSPIGLWVSFACAVSVATRWGLRQGVARTEIGRAAAAAALFLVLCGYVFVSVTALNSPPTGHTQLGVLLQNVRNFAGASLLPVSEAASFLSDLQLGWSLFALILVGIVGAVVSKSPILCSLGLPGVILLLLALPVPGINKLLWTAVPQAVLDATNAAPTQRLYAIIAACVVILGAACLAELKIQKRWRNYFLVAAVIWSGIELKPFIHRGALITNTQASSDQALLSENIVLTRYSLAMLSFDDKFFSNGVMDFSLEQRVLDEDRKTYIVSNVGSIAPGHDFGSKLPTKALSGALVGSSPPGEHVWVNFDQKLTLEPGRSYLLALDITNPDWTGTLQIRGDGLLREYALPSSGMKFAFGTGPENSRVIPLSSTSTKPVELTVNFINPNPDIDMDIYRDFARFDLIRYDPEALPIRLESMAPYIAKVSSPARGWLETFRAFVPGWSAVVNGSRKEVIRSINGLVTVPIEKGESEVRLVYNPPALVRVFYWITLLGWALLIAGAIWRSISRNLS